MTTRVGGVGQVQGSGTAWSFLVPGNVQDGDVALVFGHKESSGTVTPPAGKGYTGVEGTLPESVSTNHFNWWYVATLQATDAGTTHAFTFPSTWREGYMLVLRGVDPANILAVTDPAASLNGTDLSAETPSESSTNYANAWVIWTVSSWHDSIKTFPGTNDGYTVTREVGSNADNIAMGYAEYTSVGAVSSYAVSLSATSQTWITKTIVIRPYVAPGNVQKSRPTSTISRGTWEDQTGGTTDIHQTLDETVRDDADYIRSSTAPANDVYEFGLGPFNAPDDNTALKLRVAASYDGGAGPTPSLTIELRNGASALSTPFSQGPVVTTVFQLFEYTLSTAQADALIAASDRRGRLTANQAASAPQWQANGGLDSGTGAVTPQWPTHIAGDVGLLFVETAGGEAATLSTPSGFVEVANSPSSTGSGTAGTRLTVFWCRATSSAMAAPVVADSGNHQISVILTFRGVISTGDPWHITSATQNASASTSVSIPGVTTTIDNCLIVYASTADNDANGARFSGESNASLTDLVERFDDGNIAGNGGGIAVWTGTKATAGATGTLTATVTNSVNAHMVIALRPATNAARVHVSWVELEVPEATGLAASIAGNQPSATGTLAKVLAAFKSLTGNQPSGAGALTRVRQAASALVGSQPSATGTISKFRAAARSLTGSQPAATGALTDLLLSFRSLTGNQPAGTGTLTKTRAATQALAGTQLAPSGTIADLKASTASMAGNQPAASAALSSARSASKTLAGNQPSSAGAISTTIHFFESLVGDQLAASGSLSRFRAAASAIIGNQPGASGAVTKTKATTSSLAGNQPSATAAISADRSASRLVAGLQPTASGSIERVTVTSGVASGEQPAPSGSLTGLALLYRSLTGQQPTATGLLALALQLNRSLSGNQPSATGTVAISTAGQSSLNGVQPAGAGSLAKSLVAWRVTVGNQPAAVALIASVKTSARALTGSQLAATATITKLRQVSRVAAGIQPAPSSTLTDQLHAFKALVGAQPAASAVVTDVKIASATTSGNQPAGVGNLNANTGSTRTVSGAQPAPSAIIGMRLGLRKSLVGAQPSASGSTAQTKRSWRSLIGTQPASSGTISRVAFLSRSVNGNQPMMLGGVLSQSQSWAVTGGSQDAPTGNVSHVLLIGYPANKMRSHIPFVGIGSGTRVGRTF